jgi:hypothetical protein
MSDWKKTRYQATPPPNDSDDLWTWENLKFGFGAWLLVIALAACVALLVAFLLF